MGALTFAGLTAPEVVADRPVDSPVGPGKTCITASCHEDLASKTFVHAVAEDGTSCDICHTAVEEARHGFALNSEEGLLCAECHDVAERGESRHSPAEEGMCTACHDPHQSDYRRLLLASRASELCLQCHDDASFKRGFIHQPVADGDCSACHDPHAAADSRLLRGSYPSSAYARLEETRYLCFDCHIEEAFSEPRTLTETAFRNGNLNLHFRHVNRIKGRSCRNCHDPHSADRPALIRKQVPFGSASIAIEDFERTETGGRCQPTCHVTAVYDRLVPAFTAIKVTPRLGEEAEADEVLKAPGEKKGDQDGD